jgi:hypothetical protein
MADHENTQDEGTVEEPVQDPMRAMAQAFSSPSKAPTGTFEGQLSAEENAQLDAFVAWLRTEDPKGTKTENTSNSYKSYVAQALVHFKAGGTRADLSTDVRSGVNAFARFLATQA